MIGSLLPDLLDSFAECQKREVPFPRVKS